MTRQTSGRAAAEAALASLGYDVTIEAVPPATASVPADTDAYRMDWMRALMTTGGLDVVACTCEEVTRRDLLEVQPPRYLQAPVAGHNLATLAEDGPVNQDQIKRLTRACMGPCQARRCREQVAMIMAIGTAPAARFHCARGLPRARPPAAARRARGGVRDARHAGWLERLVRHPHPVDSL